MTGKSGDPRTLVVVAFAEALAGPEVVWSLVDAGFAVIGVTRRGARTALSHSRFVTLHDIPAPESDAILSQRALTDLLTGIRRRGGHPRHAVLPLDDAAISLCDQAASDAGWTYAGPGGPLAAALALDKGHQVDAARAAGLAVPPTVVAGSAADLDELPFGFPLILRPAQAVHLAGRRLLKGRNWICCDADELAAAVRGWNGDGPLLVQPFLEGTGEGIFGLMTDSGVEGWSAHRRLRMMNPHGSGSSACVSRAVDEALKAPIETLLRDAGWRGMFMVELLRDAGGTAHFIEFNGRAWGSMALARRLGLEYPAWSVMQALGEAPPVRGLAAPRSGVICRNIGRELMHLLFVLRGRRSRALRHWPGFWRAVRDMLHVHGGEGLYNWRRDDWRVFASDCYYTVLRNVAKPRRS